MSDWALLLACLKVAGFIVALIYAVEVTANNIDRERNKK